MATDFQLLCIEHIDDDGVATMTNHMGRFVHYSHTSVLIRKTPASTNPVAQVQMKNADTAVAIGNLIHALNAWKSTTPHTAPPAFSALVAACQSLVVSANAEKPAHQGWRLGDPITEEMHQAACAVLVRADGLDGTPQRMLDAMLNAAPKH